MSFVISFFCCVLLFGVFVLGGGNPALLFDWRSVLLVVGGVAALSVMSFPAGALGARLRDAARTMRRTNGEKLEEELISLAMLAREKGMLALEDAESRIANALVREGVLLISGAASQETVCAVLQKQADGQKIGEQAAQELFERMAYLAMGIGAAGTLLKIVLMLHRYTGPQTLAPGIAGALLPVAYGALLAYVVFLPLAARVRTGSIRQQSLRQAAMEGILAVQAGESMFVVQERLRTILHPTVDKHARANR
ncbi:MAG: MotA/TolQ/ExbB proton channel family protein [Ethanoligenens sp.]